VRARPLLLVCSLLAACGREAPSPPAPASAPVSAPALAAIAAPASVPAGASEAAGVRFLERVTGGASAGDRLPLVIGIHGYGDRPEAFSGLFDGFPAKARFIYPYGGEAAGDGFSWFPIGSRFNPDALAAGTERAGIRLAAMITALAASRPTAGRPIVTGFSQGGMLSYTLAVLHPDAVAEAFPLGGLLSPPHWPSSWAAGKVEPRIEAFHGDADPIVPFAVDRQTSEHLRAIGLVAELHAYPGVGHTVTAEMRRDLYAALAAAVGRAAAR
jgi:phospholipase/carboxylesterase